MILVKNSDIGRLALRVSPKEISMGVNIILLNSGGLQIYIMRSKDAGGDISLVAYPNNWRLRKEKTDEIGEFTGVDSQRYTLDEIEKIMMEWV